LLSCPDRRRLAEVSAAMLSITQDELMERVARKTKLPFLNRVAPIDLAVLPHCTTISSFRRAGAIAVSGEGTVRGVICVDPAMIGPLVGSLTNVPIYLSTWERVAKALSASEELYVAAQQEADREKNEQTAKAATQVLEYLMGEVEKHGECSTEVFFEDTVCGYKFLTAERKEAGGSISPVIKTALYELLLSMMGENPDANMSWEDSKARPEVTIIEPSTRLQVTWVKQPKAELEQDQSGTLQSEESVVAFPKVKKAEEALEVDLDCSAPTEAISNKIQLADDYQNAGDAPMVLIVDDNPAFACVLERFLKRYEIKSKLLENGEEALSLLNGGSCCPALIVCDVHMPLMNGFEFLKRVRGHAKYSNLPVIMLTSDEDVETELRLLSDGADVYLRKSEDPRILCVQVQRLLKEERKEAA
ncbi:response regulator, partial [Oligoflexia bacterium]|nr:response regulator [Oligoflexia bacterium]